jgi:hypothetical protein
MRTQYSGEFTPCFYNSHKELLVVHLYMPIRVYFPLSGFWKSLEGKPSRTDGQVRFAARGLAVCEPSPLDLLMVCSGMAPTDPLRTGKGPCASGTDGAEPVPASRRPS